jgi:hypothetical protein
MKRFFAVISLIVFAVPALAAPAFFTGRRQQTQTARHEIAWTCQYSHGGKTFWRTFRGTCPAQVRG